MPDFQTQIIRSPKRKKTVSAKLVKDILYIYAPSYIAEAQLTKIVDSFKSRVAKSQLRKELKKNQDLNLIAQRLNERYFNGKLHIKSIEYSVDQDRKFGCCDYNTKCIRISHRLKDMPEWVRDYVIVHEMAHLVEPNHSGAFWKIIEGYKLAERAKGFLLAKGLEENETD